MADLHAYSANALKSLQCMSGVEEMLYLDTRHWLPANLLLRGDRMTMAHSLELRCPFLDYRLVEFAAQRVPLSAKIRRLSGKWLLKTLARTLLPPGIVQRRKWGFKVPTSQWFRGPLRDLRGPRQPLPRGGRQLEQRPAGTRAAVEGRSITGLLPREPRPYAHRRPRRRSP